MKQRMVVEVLKLVKRLIVDPEFRAIVLQLRHTQISHDLAVRATTVLRDRTPGEFVLAALHAAESKPARITATTLFKVLHEHPDAIGKVNRVLMSLRRADRIALFDYLERWLAHRPADFQRIVEAESAGSETPPGLAMALADWANRETLRAALSRSRMREVYLRELFPITAEVKVPVGVIQEESQHANKVDMAYVCAIATARGAKAIFEFGTYRGQTTIALAGISDDVRVYTLNIPPEDDPRYAPYIGQFIQASPHRARITQLFVHSGRLDTTPYAQQMDFIFIDGDHSYEMVKNDSEKALQMLRPGGTIIWHDYAAKTAAVVDYLREFSQDRPLFHIRNTCLAVFMDGVNAETMSLSAMPPSLEAEEVSPDGRPLPAAAGR